MSSIKQFLKNTIETISGYDIKFVYPGTFHLMKKTDDEVEGTWRLYDRLCQLRVKTIIEKYQINLVIDVGANEGQFASELRRNGYQGKIISFEPISSAFTKLKAVASNDRHWDVYNFALGTQNTEQKIHISDDSCFTSFLKSNDWCEQEFGEGSLGKIEETVTVRRLDEVLDEIGDNLDRSRIYLKMDTQGYDLKVFAGLGNMHERILGLQSEVSVVPIYEGMPHFTDSISCFEQAGFEIAGMYPVSTEQSGLRTVEFDCLMVKSSRL